MVGAPKNGTQLFGLRDIIHTFIHLIVTLFRAAQFVIFCSTVNCTALPIFLIRIGAGLLA